MVHYVTLVCVLVLTFTLCEVTGQKQQRKRWLETRLKTLESRLNIEAVQKEEEYAHIVESVSSLNLTISNLYNMLTENDPNQNTDGITSYGNDHFEEFQRKITAALKDEKYSVRNTIKSLNNQLELFKKQQQQSRDDEIRDIKREVTDIRREFRDHQQSTSREIEDSKIDIGTNKREIRALRNEMNDKLLEQQSQIKSCLDTLESIKLANQKIKTDLTGLIQESESQLSIKEKSRTCEDGWRMYNDFCYRLFTDRKTHSDAQNECVKIGANLVDIQDKEEDEFLQTFKHVYSSVIWIGLHKQRGSWIWDRTRIVANYTNWYPGQPSGGRGIDCIQYISGTWINSSCTYLLYYMCKTSI